MHGKGKIKNNNNKIKRDKIGCEFINVTRIPKRHEYNSKK